MRAFDLRRLGPAVVVAAAVGVAATALTLTAQHVAQCDAEESERDCARKGGWRNFTEWSEADYRTGWELYEAAEWAAGKTCMDAQRSFSLLMRGQNLGWGAHNTLAGVSWDIKNFAVMHEELRNDDIELLRTLVHEATHIHSQFGRGELHAYGAEWCVRAVEW